ncbi:MAG: hypothetical protein CENE_03615 [Candidatus Celerinatantimonas neptuna]|nr:MAG: hypothetical protein CENE_03615 [Candidatus Celerinatantimonas neptuna]
MNSREPYFLNYLRSPIALETIIFPIILNTLIFWVWGAGSALLVTIIYGGLIELRRKEGRSVSIILLLLCSGAFHYLYLKGFRPFGIHSEAVILSLSSALSVVIIFGIYSLINRPILQVFAEQAAPHLRTLDVSTKPLYRRVWHEISIVWIVINILKLFVIYGAYCCHFSHLKTLIFVCGWPLTVFLIALSFQWPKWRWRRGKQSQLFFD